MSNQTDHLAALELRLSNERCHLAKEKTERGRALRKVWIAQIEKEIAEEKVFLTINETPDANMSDTELLDALGL